MNQAIIEMFKASQRASKAFTACKSELEKKNFSAVNFGNRLATLTLESGTFENESTAFMMGSIKRKEAQEAQKAYESDKDNEQLAEKTLEAAFDAQEAEKTANTSVSQAAYRMATIERLAVELAAARRAKDDKKRKEILKELRKVM